MHMRLASLHEAPLHPRRPQGEDVQAADTRHAAGFGTRVAGFGTRVAGCGCTGAVGTNQYLDLLLGVKPLRHRRQLELELGLRRNHKDELL